MSAPKTTLALIEDLVAYRDRVSDRADRDMLANVANEISTLYALQAELLDAASFALKDLRFKDCAYVSQGTLAAAIAKATNQSEVA